MLESADATSAPQLLGSGPRVRRAERFTVRVGVALQLDRTPAVLIDLSQVGAQVLSPTAIKPGQRVVMSVADKETRLRFFTTVVWASFERPGGRGMTGYRAGLRFVNADREQMAAFCQRNRQVPEFPRLVERPMTPPRVAVGTSPSRVSREAQQPQRRTKRLTVHEGVQVQLDGSPAILVDLSTTGAQVLSPAAVRLGQRVRMSLTDEAAGLQFAATVVWASFELSRATGITGYRAGVSFIDPDRERIAAFAMRNRKTTNAPPLAESTSTPAASPTTPVESLVTPDEPPPAQSEPRGAPAESSTSVEKVAAVPVETKRDPKGGAPESDRSRRGEDATTTQTAPTKKAARKPNADQTQAPNKTRRRDPATTGETLRDLPKGTPIVIVSRKQEQVVSLVKVKRSRFLAKAPDGRTLDLPLKRFVRIHSD